MRILIVKTSAFGDIIHAYPPLEYLKAKLPDCQIDWVVEKKMAGLVQRHPFVFKTIEIDSKSWRKSWWQKSTRRAMQEVIREIRSVPYDLLFDFQGNLKSALITKLARAKDKVGFGFRTVQERLAAFVYTHRFNPPSLCNVREENLYLVQKYFDDFSQNFSPQLLRLEGTLCEIEPKWMICPGSNWKNKQLTPQTLMSFLQRCKNDYQPDFVFLCGTDAEEATAKELSSHFAGALILCRPSLPELQHLMRKMKLVISMDSLPLHLAASANCPTFSLFGPSSSNKYKPLGTIHGSFQGICPYDQQFDRRCSKLRSCSTGACLREVNLDNLYTSFQNWYASFPHLKK